MGAFLFWAHRRGIRTRKGAELRKRETFSSVAREERSDEAGRGRRQPHADIPHRPPLNCQAASDGGLSFFQAQRMGFEPTSTSVTKAVARKWQK